MGVRLLKHNCGARHGKIMVILEQFSPPLSYPRNSTFRVSFLKFFIYISWKIEGVGLSVISVIAERTSPYYSHDHTGTPHLTKIVKILIFKFLNSAFWYSRNRGWTKNNNPCLLLEVSQIFCQYIFGGFSRPSPPPLPCTEPCSCNCAQIFQTIKLV